jgi:hypothetical protein
MKTTPIMTLLALGAITMLLVGSGARDLRASELRSVPLTLNDMTDLRDFRTENLAVQCGLSYYYLLEGCAYVTVVEGIGENETYVVHFTMTDVVPWATACDTTACLTLDTIELVFYDALPPPADQDMILRIFGSDGNGEPTGNLLASREFAVAYTDTAAFTPVVIDFTNGGAVDGLDLAQCRGDFVALLTWKNATGHPLLVLDNVSACAAGCPANSSCCQMGTYPYVYPRTAVRTYYYGIEPDWGVPDPVPDPAGAVPYGYLEALWRASFCEWSAATVPATWGSIKAMYK